MNPSATLRLFASVTALLFASSPARAALDEGAGTVYEKESYPTQELVRQPLTLSRGLVEIGIPVRIEASNTDSPRVPSWSIPASLDYGVSDSIQIGVFHSTGLCPGGSGNDCPEVYDDVGGRLRLGLFRRDPADQLALEVRAFVSHFTDLQVTGALGLQYKRTLGKTLAFLAAVDWTTSLNDRNNVPFTDAVAAAIGLQLQIFPGLSAFGLVGADRPFNENPGFSGKVAGPVSAGLELTPVHSLTVGADVRFSNVVGEDDASNTAFSPLERFGRARDVTVVNLKRGDERFVSIWARLFL